MLPAPLHWLHGRRFLHSSLDPRAALLTSSFQIWERSQPAAMNVTVIYSLQPLTLQGAPSSAGHALSVGEHRKMSAHAPACLAVGVSCLTLALEALGGMSEAKTTLLSRIDRILGQHLWDLTFGLNSSPLPALLRFSLPWECRHSSAP